jgi:hypothetical protein
MKRRSNAFRLGLTTLALGASAVTLTGRLAAQSNDFNTEYSIAEIMDAIIMREADVIWNGVYFASTEDGFESVGPETEDDWAELRHAAITLAEATNNLVIPGRHANVAGAVGAEGELSPAEIDAKMIAQRPVWVAFARSLRATAEQAVAAVDSRDTDRILDVGGAIDEACEACHLVFWYPDQ